MRAGRGTYLAVDMEVVRGEQGYLAVDVEGEERAGGSLAVGVEYWFQKTFWNLKV